MHTFERRYYYYRRTGFHPGRAMIMATPLWLSMIIVPIAVAVAFLLLIRIV
jgi:hypothetical protein